MGRLSWRHFLPQYFSLQSLVFFLEFSIRPFVGDMLRGTVNLQALTLQKITAFGIFLGGCALAIYAATETAAGNTRTLILIFAAICGGIFVINLKENFWLIIPVGLSLNLPTIPLGFRQISSQELAVAVATLLFILRIAMHNQPIKLRPIWSWPIFFYLACVALSYTLHPVGLWAFGSNSGGARFYVQILLAFFAFLILSSIVPKERHLKFILIACLIGNLITAGWQVLCYFLFPAFTWLTTAPTAFAEEEGFYTWHQVLSQVTLPVYTFILVSMPFQRLFSVRNLFWSIPCLILCLVFTALSGKRAAMAMMFLFPLIIALARKEYLFLLLGGFLATVLLSVAVLGQGRLFVLPLAAQRTLVNLPGQWDERVLSSTTGLDKKEQDIFRSLMNEKAWEIIKDKPLTGRGLSIDLKEMVALIQTNTGINVKEMDALAAGSSWHHKWLGISADIGIPAAIFYGFFNLLLLILYTLLVVRSRNQGWCYAFSLFQLCFVVRFILLSTTGGHTATSPMEEWWVYGIGLSLLASLNPKMDLDKGKPDLAKSTSITQ
ncbi:MAG: hypothetical protein EBY22_06310 [Gammaproteobacteria bacterium]|nr:hypothetical protein [Gammaproteobacteria bacterium]